LKEKAALLEMQSWEFRVSSSGKAVRLARGVQTTGPTRRRFAAATSSTVPEIRGPMNHGRADPTAQSAENLVALRLAQVLEIVRRLPPKLSWSSISERRITMENSHRRLMWHGMFLFLLGLITGFAEQHFSNIRMGLAAHLEGVMNGTFLLALGAAWPEVRLAGVGKAIAYWAILYSTYANWFFTTLAAILATSALSPITGAAHAAQPWQEAFVTAGLMSVGIVIVVSTVIILWGLRGRALQR
jgi:hydroxylaminobenzene mutase